MNQLGSAPAAPLSRSVSRIDQDRTLNRCLEISADPVTAVVPGADAAAATLTGGLAAEESTRGKDLGPSDVDALMREAIGGAASVRLLRRDAHLAQDRESLLGRRCLLSTHRQSGSDRSRISNCRRRHLGALVGFLCRCCGCTTPASISETNFSC